MLPINNSDTAWLIVSDYNQDNDIPYKELREDIVDPDINHWYWEWEWENCSSVIGGVEYMINDEVGCRISNKVGGVGYGQTMHLGGSSILIGNCVGGHDTD